MKIYNIKIRDSVHEFVGDLGEYIFRMSFDFENSKTIMNNIYKDIFSLKIFPNRFPSFNDKFRVMTINKKYRVFFVVDEENTTIIVSRIFFSSENYLEGLID
ncbi:MAG: hypothetical protein Q8K30_02975 [Candidatus Gracilibacteria bacterium]|nr:hypothetical protein [Candidatus Gracilibacteria bacterium]